MRAFHLEEIAGYCQEFHSWPKPLLQVSAGRLRTLLLKRRSKTERDRLTASDAHDQPPLSEASTVVSRSLNSTWLIGRPILRLSPARVTISIGSCRARLSDTVTESVPGSHSPETALRISRRSDEKAESNQLKYH